MSLKIYFKYAIQILVGILFLTSGVLKAMDSESFSVIFSAYGFGWAGFLAPVISSAEVILGLCLIFNIQVKITSMIAVSATFLFTIVYAYAFFNRGVKDCGCMGPLIKVPPVISFSRNIFIIVSCTWVWLNFKNSGLQVHSWKKWIVYLAGSSVMIISGYSLSTPIIKKDEKIHVGDQVSSTFLKFMENKISKDTSIVFIFRPDCYHCWNATENVKNTKRTTGFENVIGLTFSDADTSQFMNVMRPNFEVLKYPIPELYEYVIGVPVMLILENGKVIKKYDGSDIPCGPMLRKDLN